MKEKEILLTFIGETLDYKEAEYIYLDEGGKENVLVKNGYFYIFELSNYLDLNELVIFVNNSLNYGQDLGLLFETLPNTDIREIEDKLEGGELEEVEKYINNNTNFKIKLVEINDKNLEQSFEKIKETIEELKKDVNSLKINIDITHSYRHLPLFVLFSLDIFNIKEKSEIKNIFYAIEDSKNKFKILRLKDYILFMNFSKALRNFEIHGQLYDFAQELKKFSEKGEVKKYADLLEETDFYLNLNYLDKLRESFKNLNDRLPSIKFIFEKPPLNYIYNEFEKFVNSFQTKKISDFQFKLAKWHLEHRRYALGLIALKEAFISKYIEEFELGEGEYNENIIKSRDKRKNINNPLENTLYSEFGEILNHLRNISAHNLGTGENQRAVENYKRFENRNKRFLKSLSPKDLEDYFPKSLEEIFNSIKRG